VLSSRTRSWCPAVPLVRGPSCGRRSSVQVRSFVTVPDWVPSASSVPTRLLRRTPTTRAPR